MRGQTLGRRYAALVQGTKARPDPPDPLPAWELRCFYRAGSSLASTGHGRISRRSEAAHEWSRASTGLAAVQTANARLTRASPAAVRGRRPYFSSFFFT